MTSPPQYSYMSWSICKTCNPPFNSFTSRTHPKNSHHKGNKIIKKMYLNLPILTKMLMFYCHLSFLEGISSKIPFFDTSPTLGSRPSKTRAPTWRGRSRNPGNPRGRRRPVAAAADEPRIGCHQYSHPKKNPRATPWKLMKMAMCSWQWSFDEYVYIHIYIWYFCDLFLHIYPSPSWATWLLKGFT